MKLKAARAAGILKSPSMPRWLAHGEIPHIRPTTQGVTRDLSAHDLVVCRVFELVEKLGGIYYAQKIASQASAEFQSRNFSSLEVDWLGVTVIINMTDIVTGIRKAEVSLNGPAGPSP